MLHILSCATCSATVSTKIWTSLCCLWTATRPLNNSHSCILCCLWTTTRPLSNNHSSILWMEWIFFLFTQRLSLSETGRPSECLVVSCLEKTRQWFTYNCQCLGTKPSNLTQEFLCVLCGRQNCCNWKLNPLSHPLLSCSASCGFYTPDVPSWCRYLYEIIGTFHLRANI